MDSVLLFRHFLFTSGDRRVLGSDYFSGETLGQVTRDSGRLPVLIEMDGSLFCCSSNGSIRTYLIAHNFNRMTLDKTMWEHSRSIMGCLKAFPVAKGQGRDGTAKCIPHGIENHICYVYTCGEDRLIKVRECMHTHS